MKNPCYNCPKAGCGVYHDKCPEYQQYKSKRNEQNEQRYKHVMLMTDHNAISQRHYLKALKYNKRG